MVPTFSGTPGATRTHYIPLRRRALYPGEVRGLIELKLAESERPLLCLGGDRSILLSYEGAYIASILPHTRRYVN